MKVGITFGTFDLVHAGHMIMFKEAKEHCDYLIIGLHADPSVERPTKHSPIMTVKERGIILEACKYIDEIIVYQTEADLLRILKEEQPDIRIIGADHKDKPFTGDNLDIPVYFNSRNHMYSSSELRERIKNS